MDEQTVTVDDPPPSEMKETPTAPLPPPSGAPLGSRPWYRTPVSRDRDGNWFGGVINGLSRAFGFDVRASRIALAIATLVLPVLIVVYVVAWIVLPPSPAQARPLQDLAGGRRRLPLVIVLGAVLVVGAFASFGSFHLLGGIPWGVGLIAVGVLLWLAADIRHDAEPNGVPGPPPPPATPTMSTDLWAGTEPTGTIPATAGGPHDSGRAERDATRATARAQRDVARAAAHAARKEARRNRKRVGLYSVLTAFAFLAIGAAGDALDWWNLPVLTGTIVVLVILALGAAISALVNRSWRTVPILVLLTAAIGLLSISLPDLDGGLGDRTVRPITLEQAKTLHELGVGELTVDLTQLELAAGQSVPVRAAVGIGRLHLIVPAGARIEGRAEVGAGTIQVEGVELSSGLRIDEQIVDVPDPSGTADSATPTAPTTIVLDLEVGMGAIQIDRAG